jgi:hypothetical protein
LSAALSGKVVDASRSDIRLDTVLWLGWHKALSRNARWRGATSFKKHRQTASDLSLGKEFTLNLLDDPLCGLPGLRHAGWTIFLCGDHRAGQDDVIYPR